MKNINYKKFLLLPSNGLSYESICSVYPLTNSCLYAFEDYNITRNETEFITSIVDEFIELKTINILDLYYYDLCFIWQYLYNTAFSISYIEKRCFCENKDCKHEQNVKIDNSKLEIKYLEKDAPKHFVFEMEVNKINVKIIIDRRRVKHNIISSNLNVGYSFKLLNEPLTEKEQLDYFLNLIIPQIISIQVNDNESKEDTKKILLDISNYFGTKGAFIYEIFFKVVDHIDFGILNNLSYNCPKCGTKNNIKLIDTLGASIYSIKDSKEIKGEINDFFTFVHTKLISFSEVMNIPIYLNKIVLKQISNTIEKSTPKNYSTPADMGIGVF